MADAVLQATGNILSEGANLVDTQNIVTVPVSTVQNGQEVGDDILQQAFQEASGPFEAEQVSYTHDQVQSVASLADGTGITLPEGSVISGVEDGDIIYTLSNADVDVNSVPTEVQEIHNLAGHQMNGDGDASFLQQVVGQINPQSIGDPVVGGRIVVQLQESTSQGAPVGSAQLTSLNTTETQVTVPPHAINNQLTQAAKPEELVENNPASVLTPPEVGKAHEPLGSSQNPIRIVQQGNQYTSLQQLTAEQLSQIMQVVQQQQLMKTSQGGDNASSVLFNPQTQTRIVYKVLYPSELHKRSGSATNSSPVPTGSQSSKPRTQICVPTDSIYVELPKRAYRKRNKNEEDDKVNAPELSKEEKDDRKKHRPRTRSGRVSRPPKHMVKDYKHIHPVDWDEEYDDSDGGYSDFHPSSGGEDGEIPLGPKRKRDGSYKPYSLIGHGKDKPWKCMACDKAYIGKAGLARHYRLAPDHGKDDENFKDIGMFNGMDSGNSMDSMPGNHAEMANDDQTQTPADPPLTPSASLIQNSSSVTRTTTAVTTPSSQASSTAMTLTPKPGALIVQSNGHSSGNKPPADRPETEKSILAPKTKPLTKTKQPQNPDSIPLKRKAKLKDLIRDLDDEDLMEIVLPRLCKSVSTWEFLLMKVERGRPIRPQLVDLLQEYAQLYRRIRRMTDEQLRPLATDLDKKKLVPGSTQIQISDELVAHSLNLSTGMYAVDLPRKDNTFRYKLLTTSAPECAHHPSTKRTLEAVPPQDLVAPSPKRVRLQNQLVTDTSNSQISPAKNQQPAQFVNPAVPADSVPLKPLPILMPPARPQHDEPEGLLGASDPVLESGQITNPPQSHDQPSDILQATAGLEAEDHMDTSTRLSKDPQQQQQQQQITESHSQGSNGTINGTTPSDTDLPTMPLANHSVSPPPCDVASLGSTTDIPHPPQYAMEPVDTDPQVKQEPNTSQIQPDTNLIKDCEPSLSSPQVHSDTPPPIFTVALAQSLALDTPIFSESAIDTQSNSLPLKTESPDSVSNLQNSTSLTSQFQSVSSGLEPTLAPVTPDIVPGPPGVDTSMVPSVDEPSYSSQIPDNMTQQFVTDDGLILQDNATTRVLVQDEVFLNQPPVIDGDPNTQGAVQDPNTDDRLILIKNPDGTIQIHRHGNQPISLETLQALLGMELDGPMATVETTNAM